MQRARNWCGGHGQHVDGGSQGFQPLFYFDAEALFFVDHQQTQVVEVHVGLRQSMGADHQIDGAIDQSGNGFTLLPLGGEAA